MKVRVLLTLFVAAAALGAWYLGGGTKMDAPESLDLSQETSVPLPTFTVTDGVEVFQKAFWKRPTPEDRILHAERQEWADADGVDRWQWFIEVEPSTALARYLKEQNPFRMVAAEGEVAMPTLQVPEWFPESVDRYEVQRTADGQMMLLMDPDDGRLYATSHGRGFAKAADAPPPVPEGISTNAQPGRLPITAPPTPPPPKRDP